MVVNALVLQSDGLGLEVLDLETPADFVYVEFAVCLQDGLLELELELLDCALEGLDLTSQGRFLLLQFFTC